MYDGGGGGRVDLFESVEVSLGRFYEHDFDGYCCIVSPRVYECFPDGIVAIIRSYLNYYER